MDGIPKKKINSFKHQKSILTIFLRTECPFVTSTKERLWLINQCLLLLIPLSVGIMFALSFAMDYAGRCGKPLRKPQNNRSNNEFTQFAIGLMTKCMRVCVCVALL